MANDRIVDTITGYVARVNDHGFQLSGREGWLNLSKYASPRPRLPTQGHHVQADLDSGGYVRVIVCLEDCEGIDPDAPDELVREIEEQLFPPDKDTRITRMNVLTTATAILSSGMRDAAADDVIALAARLEAWVSRS